MEVIRIYSTCEENKTKNEIKNLNYGSDISNRIQEMRELMR